MGKKCPLPLLCFFDSGLDRVTVLPTGRGPVDCQQWLEKCFALGLGPFAAEITLLPCEQALASVLEDERRVSKPRPETSSQSVESRELQILVFSSL